MQKVKGRLIKQQTKVNNFEEKQQRMENKKFHKAIKAYKQAEKHKEKRSNNDKIEHLKKQIKSKGGDADGHEFDQMFQTNTAGAKNSKAQKKNLIHVVKERHEQQQKQKKSKTIAKNKNKRPGKSSRGGGGGQKAKRR